MGRLTVLATYRRLWGRHEHDHIIVPFRPASGQTSCSNVIVVLILWNCVWKKGACMSSFFAFVIGHEIMHRIFTSGHTWSYWLAINPLFYQHVLFVVHSCNENETVLQMLDWEENKIVKRNVMSLHGFRRHYPLISFEMNMSILHDLP